jgi:hypothetical protein
LEYGATQQLQLEGAKTVEGKYNVHNIKACICFLLRFLLTCIDAVARVRNYILSTPDICNDTSKVINGGGWDHTVWPTAGWPTAVCISCQLAHTDVILKFAFVG